MKETKLNQNSIDFGNTTRDVLLDRKIEAETARAKVEEAAILDTTVRGVSGSVTDAKAGYVSINVNLLNEDGEIKATTAIPVENNLVVKEIDTVDTSRGTPDITGRALIFNEADGGGIKYEKTDSTGKVHSFIGVHNGEGGGYGQIYVTGIDEQDAAVSPVKINLHRDRFEYINSFSSTVTNNEIATLGKVVNLLGNEAASGQPYHFPYHLALNQTAENIGLTAYTITLDNTKTLTQYPFTIPAATDNLAGLVTAADHTKITNSVQRTGDTMTGDLKMSTMGTEDLSVATKKYVDDHGTSRLNIENGTGEGSAQMKAEGGATTVDFTNVNPHATALDETITGNIPYGATGEYATAFGGKNVANGTRSFAEGDETFAKGKYSHAEGNNSVTLGNSSHAEGYATVTGPDAIASHAEGTSTQAKGEAAHAEGSHTIANGVAAHAEGDLTTATGDHSHAGGSHTVAGYDAQTVIGRYNDNKQYTLFEVGNGEDDDNRANVFEVYQDGHTEVGRDVTSSDTNLTVATKGYVDNHHDSTKADNSTVVHNTGDETIGGNKTFSAELKTQTILPTANGTYNLGSSDYKWQDIYAGGDLYLSGALTDGETNASIKVNQIASINYVDTLVNAKQDSLITISGYDATKYQTLVNDHGTLKWVEQV